MKYLVTSDKYDPFFTNWFDLQNHWNDEINMAVYDLVNKIYTEDGINWHDIEIDHL